MRSMTDEELFEFGKQVRTLAENPFQRLSEEAREEWKRSKNSQTTRVSRRRG